jgi:Holliday junction resolvase
MKPGVAKSKGRATEVALVQYLRSYGLKVERRRLTGTKDQGDIAGWNTDNGSVCVECKSAAQWRIGEWIAELDLESDNANAETGFIACRPKGKPDPEDWIAVLRLPWLLDLLRQAGYIPDDPLTKVLDSMRAEAVATRERAKFFGPNPDPNANADVPFNNVSPPSFRGVPKTGDPTKWELP